MKPQFPHISRLFSAPVTATAEKALSLAILVGFLAYNVGLLLKPTPWIAALSVLQKPNSSEAHTRLAYALWEERKLVGAQKELLLAEEMVNRTAQNNRMRNVLGVTTKPMELLQEWQNEPDRLQEEYQFWKNVARTHPDFRDAYVAAALYAYQLGKTDESRAYLMNAQSVDPNSPAIQKIINALK